MHLSLTLICLTLKFDSIFHLFIAWMYRILVKNEFKKKKNEECSLCCELLEKHYTYRVWLPFSIELYTISKIELTTMR